MNQNILTIHVYRRIFKVLSNYDDSGATVFEVAKKTGINSLSVNAKLASMEKANLVKRDSVTNDPARKGSSTKSAVLWKARQHG